MLETPRILQYSQHPLQLKSVRCGQSAGKALSVLDVSQVPQQIGHYLAGFTGGEGSFNVSFRKRGDYAMPWQVSLCFNVSQRERFVLTLFEQHLKCGTMRSRADGVWYYEVNNFTAIIENVIPFFDRFGFLSVKNQRDFGKFKQIARLIQEGRHLSREGIEEILEIRRDMNDGGAMRRKYSDDSILESFEVRESSETARQAPDVLNLADDTVRSA